jgi:tRNA(Ile)-lysidine synthase
MDDRLFHRRVFEAAGGLISPGSRIVCGVSGGVDSMVLLHSLAKVSEIHDLDWTLCAAHLDHQLRADSSRDAEFVRVQAERMGLLCSIATIDVSAEASNCGKSIEAAGREQRYSFYADAARKTGAEFVAVGHHADDQAETVLLRMIRGTGLRGLGAMRPVRRLVRGSSIKLVRPLLELRRQDILEYATRNRIEYREDSTNADHEAATRNFVRHRLIPELVESVNPRAIEALVRLALQARRADDAIRRIAALRGRRMMMSRDEAAIVIDAGRLAKQSAAVGGEIVRRTIASLGVECELGFERIDAVLQLAGQNGQLRRLELPGRITVERRGRRLRFMLAHGDGVESAKRVEGVTH